MKKSNIERQLKKDLSSIKHCDFNAIWDKCDTPAQEQVKEKVAEQVAVTADGSTTHTVSQKRNYAALLAILIVCCCICCCMMLMLILFPQEEGLVLPSGNGYFTIDINPSLQVCYDENGIITSTQGLNSDGEQLLEGLELDGMTYDKAIKELFDECVVRGYFVADSDDNAMIVTASKSNGEKDEGMTSEVKKYFDQAFADKKMSGAVISNVDNSKYQKEAEKYGINSQKYELILKYLECGGTLDESQYQSVTVKQLYSFISKADKDDKGDKDK